MTGGGAGRIRTSEGVKPAGLQPAAFGRFATTPPEKSSPTPQSSEATALKSAGHCFGCSDPTPSGRSPDAVWPVPELAKGLEPLTG